MKIKELGDWILELLYPGRCTFCHCFTDKGQKVCGKCYKELPYNNDHEVHIKIPYVSKSIAPLYYKKNVRESLLRYKFQGLSMYSEIYGEFIAKSIDETGITCDIISWVPLSRKRLRIRGYDQAKLIAQALSRETGITCERTLKKTVNNPAQSGTGGPEKRKANVKNVYEAFNPENIKGKRILLVDDIVTTGSTLSECARVLHENGASEIITACLACSGK